MTHVLGASSLFTFFFSLIHTEKHLRKQQDKGKTCYLQSAKKQWRPLASDFSTTKHLG